MDRRQRGPVHSTVQSSAVQRSPRAPFFSRAHDRRASETAGPLLTPGLLAALGCQRGGVVVFAPKGHVPFEDLRVVHSELGGTIWPAGVDCVLVNGTTTPSGPQDGCGPIAAPASRSDAQTVIRLGPRACRPQ